MASPKSCLLSLLLIVTSACASQATTAQPEEVLPPDESEVATEPVSFHPEGFGWDLVWSDEFNGDEIDPTKWDHEENCWGGGNEELQCYTTAAENSYVSNGTLKITALEQAATGLSVSEDDPSAASAPDQEQPYTSARLRSKELAEWTYGRFEIRATLPEGQGLWPAIWMLPTDSPFGSWASSGEIDIMEAVNLNSGSGDVFRSVHGTLHYGAQWPDNSFSGTDYVLPEGQNPADDFHVYALEWEEGEIRWYVDDVHYATQRSNDWFTAHPDGAESPHAPFDQQFHLIMNVAVGGSWPGSPSPTTTFPQTMEVDYVRVYQCTDGFRGDASDTHGQGCGSVYETAEVVAGSSPASASLGPVAVGTFDPTTLDADFDVFIDEQSFPWTLTTTANNGSIAIEQLDDPDRGSIVEISFNTNEGVAFFQSLESYDLSDWLDGFVEFDLRVIERSESNAGFAVKVDCGFPCGSGDYFLSEDQTAIGEWQPVQVPIVDLVNQGGSSLDLSRVNTPLVIFPAWGSQEGAIIQLDNVRWTR